MRFAYIDSQGNEVPIPSLDALALRIELGAIDSTTKLYDAHAERWGPAESHEIFHTLSRDAAGQTSVGPPLVPSDPVGPPESHAETDARGSAPAPDVELPSSAGFDLTPLPVDAAKGGSPHPVETLRLDLAPPPGAATKPGNSSEGSPDKPVEIPVPDSPDMESGRGALEPPVADLARPRSTDRSTVEADSGLELDAPFEFATEEVDSVGFGSVLDLEPPMSSFDPADPPTWMEQDSPSAYAREEGGEPVLEFSRAPFGDHGAGSETPPAPPAPLEFGRAAHPAFAPPAPSRNGPPRTGPARPATRSRSPGRPVLLLLVPALIGTGGWYGYRTLEGRPAPPPASTEAVMPVVPAALEEPMRTLAGAAIEEMYEQIRDGSYVPGSPSEPSEDWLAGVYLGNASRFGDIQAFWAGVATFADLLRDEELQRFHDAYRVLADAEGLDDGMPALLTERADAGFLATRDARLRVYGQLNTLAAAALALHGFLLEHEAEIAYTPAIGFAGNPVEEAVPATSEIGDRMWDLVENITSALDALGALDRVSRDRLEKVVHDRILEVGIR
jgi:hypothetical protein